MYRNWLRANQHWFALLVGVILVAGIATGSAQSGPTLTALTVPEKNLPDGCRLRPYVPPTTSVVQDGKRIVMSNRGTSYPFPANPWTGANRTLVATVHRAIDATRTKPLPDVPLLEPGNAAAFQLKWADNIVEAHHADYASIGGYGGLCRHLHVMRKLRQHQSPYRHCSIHREASRSASCVAPPSSVCRRPSPQSVSRRSGPISNRSSERPANRRPKCCPIPGLSFGTC